MERLNPAKILVFAPNWVGDVVMATPALAALWARFPGAGITVLARPYVVAVLDGFEFADALRGVKSLESGASPRHLWADARAVRREGFDLAVLFANTFRSALFAFLAGAKRRVGYRRHWRGFLLTDGPRPVKSGIGFEPVAMVDYYLDLVALLGATGGDRRMRLAVTGGEAAQAESVFAQCGVDSRLPLAVLNPGAAFGSAKCWPPANFAAVADELAARGFEVLAVTGPREREIGEAIGASARTQLKPIWRANVGLGALKAIIARAAVLVTNDSGPRHFAAALGRPVVTIMGPTDPRWSRSGYEHEIVLRKEVECGPCMLRVCPRDHRCMILIKPAEVVEAVDRVLAGMREGTGEA